MILKNVQRLIICAPPRTGSEMLCSLVSCAGLGEPKEYLNPWIYAFADHPDKASAKAIEAHLCQLARKSIENDKPFAIKLQGWQLEMFLRSSVGELLFDGAQVVYLTRSDLRQQVISQAAAKLTGDWYQDRTESKEFSDDVIQSAFTSAYDFILSEYAIFTKMFSSTGICPLTVISEDMYSKPEDVIIRIATSLNRSFDLEPIKEVTSRSGPYKGQGSLRMQLAACAESLETKFWAGVTED